MGDTEAAEAHRAVRALSTFEPTPVLGAETTSFPAGGGTVSNDAAMVVAKTKVG